MSKGIVYLVDFITDLQKTRETQKKNPAAAAAGKAGADAALPVSFFYFMEFYIARNTRAQERLGRFTQAALSPLSIILRVFQIPDRFQSGEE